MSLNNVRRPENVKTSAETKAATDALTLPEKQEAAKIMPPFLHDLPGELRNMIYQDMGLREPSERTYLEETLEHPLAKVLAGLPGRAFSQLRTEVNSYISYGASWEVAVLTRYKVYSLSPGHLIDQVTRNTYGYGRLILAKDHWMREHSKIYPITTVALRIVDNAGTLVARICLVAVEAVAEQKAMKKRLSRRSIIAVKRKVAKADVPAKPASVPSVARNVIQKKHHVSMTVRDVTLKMLVKPLKVCTDEARKLISKWDQPGFRGFSTDQLEEVAACFEWKPSYVINRKRGLEAEADSTTKQNKRAKKS